MHVARLRIVIGVQSMKNYLRPGSYEVVVSKVLPYTDPLTLVGKVGRRSITIPLPLGATPKMKHNWVKNTDPLFRPHSRCERCALIVEIDSVGDRVYHRGGQTVALVRGHSKRPPCK